MNSGHPVYIVIESVRVLRVTSMCTHYSGVYEYALCVCLCIHIMIIIIYY